MNPTFAIRAAGFVLLLLPQLVSAQRRSYPPEFADARAETYKSIGDVELKLWIFEPAGFDTSDRRPAIVFFFGGGWRAGSPGQFESHCRYLAEQGMVAITADYRVLSRHGTKAIQCVQDGKSAIRWIRSNADRLGVDPDRIVAAGGSAGGHVAACTALIPGLDEPDESADVSSVPNALALFNPALMLAPIDGVTVANKRLIGLRARTGVEPKQISPIHHVRPDLPPTIIFHGDSDGTVPFESVQHYSRLAVAADNRCELATYENQGHGFFNRGRGGEPGEYYLLTLNRLHRFLQSLGYLEHDSRLAAPRSTNVHLRSHLDHSRAKFQQQKQGTVAFIGGSITEMGDRGHSGMVERFLQQRFPETEFNFVNAGISSTCSTTGAFRLTRDVLNHKPDLLFIEFAVNDDQDAEHARRDCIRGMEGIIRQARNSNPKMDIVVTFFLNDSMLKQLTAGQTPLTSDAHDSVANQYGVASIDLASEVAQRIAAGKLTWKEYGGTHPIAAGNRLAADLIEDLLTTAWSRPEGNYDEHPLPKPIDKNSYDRGRLVPLERAEIDASWTIGKPEWKRIPGILRSRFADDSLLFAHQVGAEASLDFQGSAIGMYVLAGPDAGTLEYSIDDQPFKQADLYHRFSRGLHYPRTVMLDADLSSGAHRVVFRISESKHRSSSGHAVRILNFVAN